MRVPSDGSVFRLAACLTEQVSQDIEILRLRFEFDPLVADDCHQGLGEPLLLLPRAGISASELVLRVLAPGLDEVPVLSVRHHGPIAEPVSASQLPRVAHEPDGQHRGKKKAPFPAPLSSGAAGLEPATPGFGDLANLAQANANRMARASPRARFYGGDVQSKGR